MRRRINIEVKTKFAWRVRSTREVRPSWLNSPAAQLGEDLLIEFRLQQPAHAERAFACLSSYGLVKVEAVDGMWAAAGTVGEQLAGLVKAQICNVLAEALSDDGVDLRALDALFGARS